MMPLFVQQGSLGIGQQVFNEFLNTGERKIMLLGPAENSLAKSIAAYSGIPDVNLLQVFILVLKAICFVLWAILILWCSWTRQLTLIAPQRNVHGYTAL